MPQFCKMFGIPVFYISYGLLAGESVQKGLTVTGLKVFVHGSMVYISTNLNVLKRL
jgi:hypothetical protein